MIESLSEKGAGRPIKCSSPIEKDFRAWIFDKALAGDRIYDAGRDSRRRRYFVTVDDQHLLAAPFEKPGQNRSREPLPDDQVVNCFQCTLCVSRFSAQSLANAPNRSHGAQSQRRVRQQQGPDSKTGTGAIGEGASAMTCSVAGGRTAIAVRGSQVAARDRETTWIARHDDDSDGTNGACPYRPLQIRKHGINWRLPGHI